MRCTDSELSKFTSLDQVIDACRDAYGCMAVYGHCGEEDNNNAKYYICPTSASIKVSPSTRSCVYVPGKYL